jgi:hypothetical protein
MIKERWVPIQGYVKLYEVSNIGNVRCVGTHKPKKQSGGPGTRCRYRYVTLYKNNVGTKIMVHRLVGIHFVPNKYGYPYVLHKDDNRENNSEINLKWGTQTHNHEDSVRNGTNKNPPGVKWFENHKTKLNPEKVREIRKIRDSGIWISQENLAAKFEISRGTLRSILKGNHWKHVL